MLYTGQSYGAARGRSSLLPQSLSPSFTLSWPVLPKPEPELWREQSPGDGTGQDLWTGGWRPSLWQLPTWAPMLWEVEPWEPSDWQPFIQFIFIR